VLKSGGLVALTAWGSLEQNPIPLTVMGPFFHRIRMPPPPPGAPHPFRFASPGSLSRELESAGFRQVEEEPRDINCAWPGPPEELWDFFREIAVPFRSILDSLPPDEQQQAIREAIGGLGRYYDGQSVNAPALIVVATGVR